MNNRRDILRVLGLGSASTALLASSEAIAGQTQYPEMAVPNLIQPSPEVQERVAQALDNLAQAIRDGTVGVSGMQIQSAISPDTWLSHKITVEVEIVKDSDPV